MDICSIDGCGRAVRARGWCSKHYARWRAHGDPHTVLRRRESQAATPECSVKGCERPVTGKGLCAPHYRRLWKTGDPRPNEPIVEYRPGATCSVEGCERPHEARGFCNLHWRRWKQAGDPGPAETTTRQRGELGLLVREYIRRETDECLLVVPEGGSRYITLNGRQVSITRAAWTLGFGDPGDSLVLHTCGNGHRSCVNLRHLYLGDHRQNMLDACRDGARNAKLTAEDVRSLRKRYAEGGVTQAELAATYDIRLVTVNRIVNRKSWAWLN